MNLRRLSISNLKQHRRGQTLLELIAASSLMAVAMVSSLRIMRDSMELGRDIETRSMLTTLAVSKMEQHLAETSATWATAISTGTFAAEGYSNFRYTVSRSDLLADGGSPDELMSIDLTVWDDQTADAALGAGEPNVSFRSKIAKMATYQDAAGTP